MKRNTFQAASDAADEVIDVFASLYPQVSLPYRAWQDLREMVEREVRCYLGEEGIRARDLLDHKDVR